MKIRQGFVSNSSSSSFLIGLLRKPRTVAELKRWLFGDMDYLQWLDYGYKTIDVACRIFDDLKGKYPIRSKSRLIKEINSGYFTGMPLSWRKTNRPSDKLEKQFYKSFPQYKDRGYWNVDAIKETMAKELSIKIGDAQKQEWAEKKWKSKKAAKKIFSRKVKPKREGRLIFHVEMG